MSRSHDWRPAGPLLGIAAAGALLNDARAEEPEPLDEEFLDYLLQLEGDEEDWTLFDSQDSESATTTSAASKPATAPPPTTKQPVAKSATAPATAPAKPTTEAKR
jgi:hypothetical protein